MAGRLRGLGKTLFYWGILLCGGSCHITLAGNDGGLQRYFHSIGMVDFLAIYMHNTSTQQLLVSHADSSPHVQPHQPPAMPTAESVQRARFGLESQVSSFHFVSCWKRGGEGITLDHRTAMCGTGHIWAVQPWIRANYRFAASLSEFQEEKRNQCNCRRAPLVGYSLAHHSSHRLEAPVRIHTCRQMHRYHSCTTKSSIVLPVGLAS